MHNTTLNKYKHSLLTSSSGTVLKKEQKEKKKKEKSGVNALAFFLSSFDRVWYKQRHRYKPQF